MYWLKNKISINFFNKTYPKSAKEKEKNVLLCSRSLKLTIETIILVFAPLSFDKDGICD